MTDKQRLRHICFTLNNYTEDEYNDLWAEETGYTILAKEGKDKTPHIQGYIEFKNPRYFKALKKKFPRIHIEERKGSAKQASDYCKKEGDFQEKGELSNQGKRTDLDRVCGMVINEEPLANIAKAHPREYVKFHKGITALHNILKPHRTEKPWCYWFWGATGVGKTYRAKNLGKDYYIKDSSKWWDGYDQQDVVIIDDFRKDNIPFDTLLRWLDENKCQVEIKGSSIPLNSRIIAITCDQPPSAYWTGNDLAQIKRRLNGGIKEYKSR